MGRSSQPVMGRPVFVSCGISVAMVNKEIGVWSMQGDGAGLTYFKFRFLRRPHEVLVFCHDSPVV